MKHLFLLFITMVCALNASAQTYVDHVQAIENGKGQVIIHQSKEIDKLINGVKEKIAESVVKPDEDKGKTGDDDEGTTVSRKVRYRVQLYTGDNTKAAKTQAENIMAQARSRFPDMPVDAHFYSPSWKCHIGYFSNTTDAKKFVTKAKSAGFPKACVVKVTSK